MKAIIGNIILQDSILENGAVILDEKIEKIVSRDELKDIQKNNPTIEIIDTDNKYVSPGFIDVHIHGFAGFDTMDGTEEAIETIAQSIPQYGVTSFLPTTMTMSFEEIYKSLDSIKKVMKKDYNGANIIGVHMEGPFVNEKYKGAQNPEFIKSPTRKPLEEYMDIIKIITYAPEEDKDNSFLNSMRKNRDTILSIGHSNGSFEEAMDAIENGAGHITHLFNAMTPLHHRNPGVVGAAFKSDVYVELIADKIHVHHGMYDVVQSIKGVDKILLITDCMRAGGMPSGEYDLGGQRVLVDENSARLENGTLAGSILTLNKAVENVFNNTEISLCDVIKMVSLNQARELGISHRKGSIEAGKDGDITVFDKNFNIHLTMVDGQMVYEGGM